MAGGNSFWDDSFDPNEAEAGPALAEARITEWEQQRGLRLPLILKRAFLQQDGGHVRGQHLVLERLEAMAPVEDGLLNYAELAKSDLSDVETGLDYRKMIRFVRHDGRGCTLLLYYGVHGPQGEPSVYGFWSDGDTIDRLANCVSELLRSPVS